MSHIPNSAMPHATAEPQQNQQNDAEGSGSSMARGYGAVKDKAKQYPKTAIAAGAAVLAGAVAAAAIPLVRGKGDKTAKSGAKSGGKSTATKSKAKA
ncbi:MAG: hypothetical protein ACK40O_12105 [Allosphingosinicella sp.]